MEHLEGYSILITAVKFGHPYARRPRPNAVPTLVTVQRAIQNSPRYLCRPTTPLTSISVSINRCNSSRHRLRRARRSRNCQQTQARCLPSPQLRRCVCPQCFLSPGSKNICEQLRFPSWSWPCLLSLRQVFPRSAASRYGDYPPDIAAPCRLRRRCGRCSCEYSRWWQALR